MTVSVGSAIGAGFSLIGRRFLAVMGWGFFQQLALVVLVVIGVLIVGAPMVMQNASAFSGAATDPQEASRLMTAFLIAIWPALLIVLVGSLFVSAIVQAAAIRATLYPDDRGFASMRLGRSEAALVLLYLLLVLVSILVWLVTAVIWFGFFMLGRAIGGFGGGFVVFLLCVAYLLGLMWLGCRFALAPAMTVAEGQVRFFGSWSLTRGHGGAAFGLAWLMVLVFIGVFVAYFIVSFIINLIFVGGSTAALMATAGQNPSAAAGAWPLLLLSYIPSLLLGAIFNGIVQALGQGPWADLYRQLKGAPDVAATFS